VLTGEKSKGEGRVQLPQQKKVSLWQLKKKRRKREGEVWGGDIGEIKKPLVKSGIMTIHGAALPQKTGNRR